MGGGRWLMTTTVVNVMLMGDDGVDDVTDLFLFLAGGLRDAALSPRRPSRRWAHWQCLVRASGPLLS